MKPVQVFFDEEGGDALPHIDVELLGTALTGVEREVCLAALESSNVGVAILSPSGSSGAPRITYVNGAFSRITGRDVSETMKRSLASLGIRAEDPLNARLLAAFVDRQRFTGQGDAIRMNGSEYAVEVELLPVERDGKLFWVVLLRDVTAIRERVALLEKQALIDVLTDLPNRMLLFDRLEQAIANARRNDSKLALMLIDLDRFKEINDALGHHVGDRLLQEIAIRLRQNVRASDTVARLGGDEFAIILPFVYDLSAASLVAEKLLKSIEKTVHLDNKPMTISASIGIAIFPAHGDDGETLLRHADVAMYRAKQTNTGVSVYSDREDRVIGSQLALAVDLRHAIEADELLLYYQPKLHIRTGLVTRVEVLSRWQHPEHGLIAPDGFIPLAERTGLIRPITAWVLDRALAQCRDWHDRGIPIHIALNLSPRSLQEPALAEKVQDALERWKVHPRYLKFEITESSLLVDPTMVAGTLSLLQSLGCRISIDDFGTGYSSIMHLRHLPIDEIKIDKSFVMEMLNNPGDAAIVRAIIDLGHNLGHQVVAEGVENEETLQALADLGCDLAQGYHLSRPVPAAELEAWLERTRWGLLLKS